MNREIAESGIQSGQNILVDLDRAHRSLSHQQRGQDISSTAGADDQYTSIAPNVMDDVFYVIPEIIEILRLFPRGNRGLGAAVDSQVKLQSGPVGGIGLTDSFGYD